MSVFSLAQLLITETQSAIYARAIEIAAAVGLPVTSWQAGDPTRSLYHLLSKTLSVAEEIVYKYSAAGFLDYATGDWLTLLAKQVYYVERVEYTYASCLCTLTNSSGGVYVFDPGDITAKNSASGKTYHNTTSGTLSGVGSTLSLQFEADEPGSGSSSAAGEIDELITTFNGVSISNATNAIGVDSESDAALRIRCRAKLGMLSPNGPKDAYNYIATSTVSTVTRAKTVGDSAYGMVNVYVASASGAVGQTELTTIENAISQSVVPQGVSFRVNSAAEKQAVVNYQLWLYDTVGKTKAEIKTEVASALGALFASRPIGGDVISGLSGALYLSLIKRTIESVYPNHAFRVELTSPSADVVLAANEVATLSHNPANSTVTLVAA